MSHISTTVDHLTQKIKDQERTILKLKDTISQLHIENSVLSQRLSKQSAIPPEVSKHQLNTLSTTILSFYNKKFPRNPVVSKQLSVREMIACLEEIFMSIENAKSRTLGFRTRSPSPAFTFANLEQVEAPVFKLQLESIESSPTTGSESNSQSLSSKEERGRGVEFMRAEAKGGRSDRGGKFGFFKCFRRKSDNNRV